MYLDHLGTELEQLPERIRAGITGGTSSVPWSKFDKRAIVSEGSGL